MNIKELPEKLKVLPHKDLLEFYVEYIDLYSRMSEGLRTCKDQDIRKKWVDQMERILETKNKIHDEILSRMMGMEIQ